MHSPLSNFLLRPRSTQHRHRRSSSSSPSALLDAATSAAAAAAELPDALNSLLRPSSSDDLSSRPSHDLPSNPRSSATSDDLTNHSSHSSSTPSQHRPSFELPFRSPYSLNVPLSTSGAYLCTLTIAINASSLCLSAGLLHAGLDSGDILVLRAPKLAECARFGIGNLPVKALLASDSTIFSAHKDHKLRAWRRPSEDGAVYKLAQTLPSTPDYLRNLVLSKRYIRIRRHHRRLWIQHVDTITSMAFDSASMLLFTASWDKTFKVWNLRSMRCMQSVEAHSDAVNAIVVSPHAGHLIYTASADSTVKVWRKLSAQKVVHVKTLAGHGASVNALAMKMEEDVGILYSAGSDCCINVWQRVLNSKHGWKLGTTLRGHRQPVLCLALSGQLVCSGGADKILRVWRRGELGSYSCLAILQGHSGPIKAVAMAVSTLRSCYVYSASLDGMTKVWSILYDKDDHEDSTDIVIKP